MKALTYINKNKFELTEKSKPIIMEATDAVVRVTLASICLSDLHILHGAVPMAEPGMGKNMTFKTGGVDACDCDEIMNLIADGKLDTTHLITHRYPLSHIQEAYDLFASRKDGVIKIAVKPD